MDAISATEAKNRLAAVMDKAAKAPLVIERNGRPFVVMMSVEEYEKNSRNDGKNAFIKFCRELAASAGKRGMTGEVLQSILDSEE